MGSFNSAPKIPNDDCQDNDVNLPKNISRTELLQYCHQRPYGQLMFKRAFKKTNGKRADESDNMGIKLRKLNAVTEGSFSSFNLSKNKLFCVFSIPLDCELVADDFPQLITTH